jgi:Pentapeptide repeats (8 copies)
VVGYDGARNVRDEERSVGRKKLVRKAEPPPKRGIAWPRWTGFRGMTVRAWLQLLIVPLALVVIGFLFTAQQDRRQQEIENQRVQQAQKIENQRAEAERELAVQRAQDEALQAYLDQMSGLLLERDLRASEVDSEVRTLARAQTLTVLERLGSRRKTVLMQFLVEADLVGRINGREPIIRLAGADLSGADLSDTDLSAADLSDTDLSAADLSGADLSGADLSNANLTRAHLSEAHLSGANLIDANLSGASLSGADLSNADLHYADLSNIADLSGANLSGADLSGADLSGADLSGVTGWTEKQLTEAKYLGNATLPSGQKYEDWLKSLGEENSGP